MYRTTLYHQVSSKSIFSFLLIMETYGAPIIGLAWLKRFGAKLVDFEQETLILFLIHSITACFVLSTMKSSPAPGYL